MAGEEKLTKVDTKGRYPSVKGKKRKMAELLVNPDVDLTVTQMCEQIGVSRQTFYNWQTDSDFKGYVEFLTDSYTDSELPNAWKALCRKVNSGNVEAMKLFFTLKDKYREKLEVDSNVVFITGEGEISE